MSEDPKPNIRLLRKAVNWVEQEAPKPDVDRRWYQGGWHTSASEYAYFLAIDRVDERRFKSNDAVLRERESVARTLEPQCGTCYCAAGYIGQFRDFRYRHNDTVDGLHVSHFAREALGLTEGQADDLFSSTNSAADIRRIAEKIAGRPL